MDDGPASRSARQRPPGKCSGPNQEPHGAPDGTDSYRIGLLQAVNKGQGTGGFRDDSHQAGRMGRAFCYLQRQEGDREGDGFTIGSRKETMKETTSSTV